ncbi:MAG: ADP-ribosylglycohydrolase family protein [Oscillospiraceae bacterium]|nr:ADP-ribosylglycohydrolase family protein [Oscillospiraceae bacterium]
MATHQVTLAVAEGIVANPDNPIEEVGARFLKWYRSRPKDIGATCSASITRAATLATGNISSKPLSVIDKPSEGNWYQASAYTARRNGNRSGGNGALMRTVYPGLFYKERLEAVETATAIAQMTHYDKNSNEACETYTDMIYLITVERQFSLLGIEQLLEGTQYSADQMYRYEPNPTGYVVDSMKCALACFRSTTSFEDTIVKAANLGGDADTIAAITGGLAGAFYGYSAIPKRWTAALAPDIRMRLDGIADAAFVNRTAK